MIEQLSLSPLVTPPIGVAFPETGSQFYNLTEKEFLQKAPHVSTHNQSSSVAVVGLSERWKAAGEHKSVATVDE